MAYQTAITDILHKYLSQKPIKKDLTPQELKHVQKVYRKEGCYLLSSDLFILFNGELDAKYKTDAKGMPTTLLGSHFGDEWQCFPQGSVAIDESTKGNCRYGLYLNANGKERLRDLFKANEKTPTETGPLADTKNQKQAEESEFEPFTVQENLQWFLIEKGTNMVVREKFLDLPQMFGNIGNRTFDKSQRWDFLKYSETRGKAQAATEFTRFYKLVKTQVIEGETVYSYHCPLGCGHPIELQSSRYQMCHNVARIELNKDECWDPINLIPGCSHCNGQSGMGTKTWFQYLFDHKKPVLPLLLWKYNMYNGVDGRARFESIFQFAYTQMNIKNPLIMEQLRWEMQRVTDEQKRWALQEWSKEFATNTKHLQTTRDLINGQAQPLLLRIQELDTELAQKRSVHEERTGLKLRQFHSLDNDLLKMNDTIIIL